MEDQLVHQRPAWISVGLIVLTILIGFIFIGEFIGFLMAIPFMNESILSFADNLREPAGHPEIKTPLFIIQSCTTFFGLAVTPAFYWWRFEKRNPFDLFKNKQFPLLIGCLTVGIVLSFMLFNSFFVEWNANVRFPDFLHGFESWARENEQLNEQLVKLFTTFDSVGQFIFAFFAISILAGFSEEFVFRGMLQPELHRATKNIHVAIWGTAILFSALHLQFFGFVPRVLLGALFGYLYYWSGNLLIPIFAHMVNNGVGIVGLYLYQRKEIPINPESTEAVPVSAMVIGALITFGLLVYFKRFYNSNNSTLS